MQQRTKKDKNHEKDFTSSLRKFLICNMFVFYKNLLNCRLKSSDIHLELILKQLFASGEVITSLYSPRHFAAQ